MATGSMMKDYVRRQLRYWVADFKDDMLPRDFMSRSYSKTQIVIPDIHLKPHRVAAVLHLPAPLLVTTVHCIELTIAVPSWTDSDKEAAHKHLLIHANELLVQVRNLWECSSKIRREAEERIQAALLEPDPLGSTAAMFAFARDVNDRTKLVVDKLNVHIFVGGIPRVEMTLADFNARTTDALWQDVKNPTTCVDYSPDLLVQTRFKAMSFMLSICINPAASDVQGKSGGAFIRLMTKVSVDVRVTRFYHRKEVEDSWKRHMQLVDVNFGAMKMEFGVAEIMEVYTVASTLCNWFLNGRSSESRALSSPEDGMAANREPLGTGQADQPNIELQVTFRGTVEAKLKFTSPTVGPQELFLVADRAAGNIILHRHGVRELQFSLHELTARFRGYVVFRLKPDREVFQLEQRHNSLSVKWRVQRVMCRIDDDLTIMLTEIYEFVNEKEQAIVIRCGTCHQQISLDMIDVHVCPPRNSRKSLTTTPLADQSDTGGSRGNFFSESSSAENDGTDAAVKSICGNGPPKVHIELHMDAFELQTGSRLVQLMLKVFGMREDERAVGRDITTTLSNLRLTTESNEFAGDAIFVPALSLAFQMLECSLQGCGCILRHRGTIHSRQYGEINRAFNWPARLFIDISQCAMSAQDCFVKVDKIQLRSSYSDGSRVCSSSQPQLSFHLTMDKVRCQLDEVLFKLSRQVFDHVGEYLSSSKGSVMMTLFLGVLQIRAVEFTLQNANLEDASAKSLLKQAIVVFDNQLGFLCTQSSLNFKTILNSQTMQFVHRQTPTAPIKFQPYYRQNSELSARKEHLSEPFTPEADPSEMITAVDAVAEPVFTDKDDTSPSEVISPDNSEVPAPTPPNLEREDACRCIQRMARRKQLVRQYKQRFEPDDYEPGIVTPIQVPAKSAVMPEVSTSDAPATPATIYRREGGKNLASLTLVMDAESGSNDSSPSSSPRKMNLGLPSPIMVLGADADIVGEIRGGISKLMSPLSRARLPSESFRGSLNKLMGPINRTLSPTASTKRRPSVESVAPMVEVASYNVTTNEADDKVDPSVSKTHPLRQVDPKQPDCTVIAESENKLLDPAGRKQDDVPPSPSTSLDVPKVNGLSESKLAALPDVVRVLVQVDECRLCVPINPREKVGFLCQEIVRRFHESFAADRGRISEVSLQDKHGAVFCPSDTVGFVLSVAPSELLFAYPHEHDEPVRSLARLTAGSARTAPSPQPDNSTRTKYSKLPLPLVIALLANESERDLIRSGLCERDAGVAGEAWPDLALNAASLDAEKNPLIVEVAWHETCVEVTNGDAFALCRQLLGLCTSRATNKYVGKILRARLKVDLSNPLIEWACRRKLHAAEKEGNDDSSTQPSDQEETLTASYDQLKKAVQDMFGVYTR